MRPLRLAFLLASLRPGGSERQMLALAERLPRDRFTVDFLTLIGPGEYDERALAAGADIHGLGDPPPPGTSPARAMLRRSTKVLRYMRAARLGRYDIVDAWLYPADVLAALARTVTGTPVIISGRRNLDPHDQFGAAEAAIERLVSRRLDAVVANSAAAAAHAERTQRVPASKLRIIRNGVELLEPQTAAERSRYRRMLGAGDGELLVGCVANFSPVKRHDLLIDAFADVGRDHPQARLALIGDGPGRPGIERRIRTLGLIDRVRLHGMELEPRPLYGAFDIVVQASRSEGLPNVLLEAGAAARPIVATAAGGTSEIVVDGSTGVLVPVDDPAALAAGLWRVAADADLRRRFGSEARRHVGARFGMDRFVREFADLYEGLAAPGRVEGRIFHPTRPGKDRRGPIETAGDDDRHVPRGGGRAPRSEAPGVAPGGRGTEV
jgi:glycosyltransferase involved in cell wall biosynthesis